MTQDKARLVAALADLAQARQTITYGALAALIGLEGAGRIARLTSLLEALMEEDAALGRPLRAALVVGKAAGGLPARGFYDKAHSLGLCPANPSPELAQSFHHAQRDAVFAARVKE
ncbi:MAG: hypothetical protein ACNA7L_09020 [Roseinatronobacter sp.]